MAPTDVCQGEGAAAARVASPSTPGAMSEFTADGHLGFDDVDDATRVVSGANSVAPADVRQGSISLTFKWEGGSTNWALKCARK